MSACTSVRERMVGGSGADNKQLYLEVRDVEVQREVKEDRWMDWSCRMSVDNG